MMNQKSIFSALRPYLAGLLLALAASWVGPATASEDEIEEGVLKMAQEQFEAMRKKGLISVRERLEAGEPIKPFATVTDTGNNTKLIRIAQVEEMPDELALEVMRRTIKVLVGKGKVGATAIFYVIDNPNKDSPAEKVLITEMEHVFGPSLAQLTPFSVQSERARFGEPVVVEREKTIFVVGDKG